MAGQKTGSVYYEGLQAPLSRKEFRMKLEELIRELDYTIETDGNGTPAAPETAAKMLRTEVTAITADSRTTQTGALFFCIEGANSDGHQFALTAQEKGTAVLVISHDVELKAGAEAPVIVRTKDTRYAMAVISAAFYGHPARELKTIGITGTKGKTTTTYLIKSILEGAGLKCGLIGTIETWYGEVRIPAKNTTPESIVLQKTFRDMADAGIQVVVMEVSSQALMLHRTAGFVFDLGIFTNLSADHIGPNEHTSFEDYLSCKSRLFGQCRFAIVNGDDEYTAAVLAGHTCSVESYGLKKNNDLYAADIALVNTPGELGVSFRTHGLLEMEAHVPMPGRFSVYNALCAIAVCRHFNVPIDQIRKALLLCRTRGRIEMIPVSSAFTLMIDYAHNAMALESLLSTLKAYDPGRLVTVFGCGGNRSRARRFEMGEVSGRLSDLTIITSDNPRFEEPMAIIQDIVTGISGTKGEYVTIPDRKEAIRYALLNGQPGDIIVLAGKGHEDYQEICGVKYPMDERNLIQEVLQEEHGKIR